MRNILKYSWAVNEAKLERSITELIKEGTKNPTEAQIKERYVRHAGKVKEVEKAVKPKVKKAKKK